MNLPDRLISHVLIGPPGCGKSTLAQEWIARSPQYVWVSTDEIREKLYGDASLQGPWNQIEAEALQQIRTAITAGSPVIYDATNVRRAWRLRLMQQLNDGKTDWMAWQFKTSLATCKARNQNRKRQVEESVLDRSFQWLEEFKPIPAEGFAAVNPVPVRDGLYDFLEIEQKVRSLPRTLQQRANKQAAVSPHPYSSLLEFERLLYLIAVLLHHPGLGNLHQTNPDRLQRALHLEHLPTFPTPAAEISALITQRYGAIYADVAAIDRNLAWLEQIGLVNCGTYRADRLNLPEVRDSSTTWYHRYSDREPFERLIQIIRFLVHHPFLQRDKPTQNTRLHQVLLDAMAEYGLQGLGEDSVRRDISEILKPYGMMEKTAMTKGYFVGTAILAQHELLRVFASLEGQAKRLDDPICLQAYETFQERLQFLHLDTSNMYPVRTVINQPIVNPDYLPANSLALPSNAEFLESAITNGEVLELRRLKGTGRFPKEDDQPFLVLPLQIVFYSIGWYLGYIRCDDELLQFERLDRLTARPTGFPRPRSYQDEARQRLHTLQKAGFRLFLGKSAAEQQKFLSANIHESAEVTDTLELWFTDDLFRFVSEGTQRFATIELSSRSVKVNQSGRKNIFTLKPTGNSHFPNRLKAKLPVWVLRDDYDLKAWILRFGNQVKVVSPQYLADEIKQRAKDILQVYSNTAMD